MTRIISPGRDRECRDNEIIAEAILGLTLQIDQI